MDPLARGVIYQKLVLKEVTELAVKFGIVSVGCVNPDTGAFTRRPPRRSSVTLDNVLLGYGSKASLEDTVYRRFVGVKFQVYLIPFIGQIAGRVQYLHIGRWGETKRSPKDYRRERCVV